MSKTSATSLRSGSKSTYNNISGGALAAAIVLALVVIGLGIAIIVLSTQSSSGGIDWSNLFGMKECTTNSQCSNKLCKGLAGCCATCDNNKCTKGMLTANGCIVNNNNNNTKECTTNSQCTEKLCKGLLGCCAICDNNKCKQGMLTANGCVIGNDMPANMPANTPANMQNFPANDNSFNMLDKQMVNSREQAFSTANEASGSILSTASVCGNSAQMSAPMSSQKSNDYCNRLLCRGLDPTTCCAVVQNGVCVAGNEKDGLCQTTVPQTGFAGYGTSYPNSYLFSTSGPVIGATMGGCTVSPISSSLQNFVGVFDSCAPTAFPQYGREYASTFAPGGPC